MKKDKAITNDPGINGIEVVSAATTHRVKDERRDDLGVELGAVRVSRSAARAELERHKVARDALRAVLACMREQATAAPKL